MVNLTHRNKHWDSWIKIQWFSLEKLNAECRLFGRYVNILCISGGPDYVQIFYNPSPVQMDATEKNSQQTRLLRDGLSSTCLPIFQEPRYTHFVAKVRPQRKYKLQRLVTLQVIGEGLSCSPVDGLRVSLRSSMFDSGNCANTSACVMMKEFSQNGLTICEARCQHQGGWDFAFIEAIRRDDSRPNPSLCEIKFLYRNQ